MNRLRNRLILVFLAATLGPLGVTLWLTRDLLDRSLSIAAGREAELDALSLSLQQTGRELYQRARADLKRRADAGEVAPERFAGSAPMPPEIDEFWRSGELERFHLSGEDGDRLEYFVRGGDGVLRHAVDLGVGMERLSRQYARAREAVERGRQLDRRRGFTYTFILLAAAIWAVSLAVLIFVAARISQPIQKLTGALGKLASGDLGVRIPPGPRLLHQEDEVGRAINAFNHTAAELEQSRDRLVYLTQLASWQSLARKMAHEVKNSLTPIRLTVEEMLARHNERDSAFLEQAAQIVVEEVESLERRIRAFSQFAAEPPVTLAPVVVNELVQERVTFLRNGHPEVAYELDLGPGLDPAQADEDLLKGVLTNLLENAAEAAGGGGRILVRTASGDGRIAIEVHDSGPGLSEQARRTLFQPTISFKKNGTGLGLSIARKSALLVGGDIVLAEGELGGAAFRVLLPKAI
ncbi:MAG: HAMP domain-containing protein [Bryobacterales bacterium]|nr:HAMP domain-containing protein [Bryobacterales bacterium]